MKTQNTLSLLNMYRERNVHAVKTPSGVVFMGVRNLHGDELKTLQAIPQSELVAALRWQK